MMRKCKGYINDNLKLTEFEGYFHEFGFCCNEHGSYSVAIIELEDGRIITPSADKIIFTDKKREV